MTGSRPGEFHTTVLDTKGLVRLLRQVAGRRFLGPVDGFGCVELVFDADTPGPNLVTIFTDQDHWTGQVALGGVSLELIEAGYVDQS